jgi:hypothetical protein
VTEKKLEDAKVKTKWLCALYPSDVHRRLHLEKMRTGTPLKELVPILLRDYFKMRDRFESQQKQKEKEKENGRRNSGKHSEEKDGEEH